MPEIQLSPATIKSNWELFREIINESFPSRSKNLNKLYDDLEHQAKFAPASSVDYFHNAINGGYIDHVLRVYENSIKHHELWKSSGMRVDYTEEELAFAAIHHDLYKVGFPRSGGEYYIPNESKWHRENQGKMYSINPNNPRIDGADMTFMLLNQYSIPYSENEFLGIRLTDGMYEDSNKKYLSGFGLETKLRSSLPYILHHADIMAFRFEFERWAQESKKFKFHNQTELPVVKEQVKSKEKVHAESIKISLDEIDAMFKV